MIGTATGRQQIVDEIVRIERDVVDWWTTGNYELWTDSKGVCPTAIETLADLAVYGFPSSSEFVDAANAAIVLYRRTAQRMAQEVGAA